MPSDDDLERVCADVAFFLAALEGLSAAALERGRPAVPVAGDRSVSRHRAALRRHVRARARPARARQRHGPRRRRVGGGAAAAVSAPERPAEAASIELKPGMDIDPSTSASCSSTPASRARIRPTSTASSAFAAASSTVSRPARTQPVRLEFIGDTIESLRSYDPATQRSIETARSGCPSCR